MTKQGNLDNAVTYEHICDAHSDLANIDLKYATLGSVAIVLKDPDTIGVYMATSEGEWISLLDGSSAND